VLPGVARGAPCPQGHARRADQPTSCGTADGEGKRKMGRESGRSSVPDPAQQGGAGDGKQRPLVPRSRCLPRLTPGVRLLLQVVCW
jgi:hypothetical protein